MNRNKNKQFRCEFCGTTNPECNEANRVVYKGENGVIYKDACNGCAGKQENDPNYLAEQFLFYTDPEHQRRQEKLEEQNRKKFEYKKNQYLAKMDCKQMKKNICGVNCFTGRIDVTDPYAEEEEYVNKRYTVAAGNYTVVRWDLPYVFGSLECDLVGAIGIYLNGNIPASEEMIYIDDAILDSKNIGIFDVEKGTGLPYLKESDDLWVVTGIIHGLGYFTPTASDYGKIYMTIKNSEIVAVEVRFFQYIPRGQ